MKAVAGSTVYCFPNSDLKTNPLDLNGNQVVASQCYALDTSVDPITFAACPAKDAITSPIGSSAMANCEGFCPGGAEYVKDSKTCQLCPVVLSFVHAYCAVDV